MSTEKLVELFCLNYFGLEIPSFLIPLKVFNDLASFFIWMNAHFDFTWVTLSDSWSKNEV